ncbi:hypothetical protein [Aeoliella sp. SH292]|uniref:hypothetical protein n=1 Tax=Aeoliella sp. SH292 TaxID=3454464 RepID=UPI003F9EB3D3
MATDTYGHETQPQRRGMSGCLKGCLIAFVVLVIISLLAAWWISRNLRSWMSAGAEQGINELIDQSDLPEAEKAELKAESKRVTAGIADGSISWDQFGQITIGVMESPLVPMFMVKSIESQYLNPSGLSEEEKVEGRKTLERYASGLMTKAIPVESADQVLSHVADKDSNGTWEMRAQVSDEELREALATAKQQADDAGVPEEVPPVDPSAELKKILDGIIGPAPGELPALEEVPAEEELEPAAP